MAHATEVLSSPSWRPRGTMIVLAGSDDWLRGSVGAVVQARYEDVIRCGDVMEALASCNGLFEGTLVVLAWGGKAWKGGEFGPLLVDCPGQWSGPGEVVNCDPPDARRAEDWVRGMVGAEAARELLKTSRPESGVLYQECQKILSGAWPTKPTAATVRELCLPSVQRSAWEVVRALNREGLAGAVKVTEAVLACSNNQEGEAIHILYKVGKHLCQVAAACAARKAGKKTAEALAAFRADELEGAVRLAKTMGTRYRTAHDVFVRAHLRVREGGTPLLWVVWPLAQLLG